MWEVAPEGGGPVGPKLPSGGLRARPEASVPDGPSRLSQEPRRHWKVEAAARAVAMLLELQLPEPSPLAPYVLPSRHGGGV